MEIKQRIFKAIESGKAAHMNSGEIFKLLKVTPDRKKLARRALDSLCADGDIVRSNDGTYATPEQLGAFSGTVLANASGYAFIRPDDGDKDFFVPKRRLMEALDKDRVLAIPVKGTEDEATVIKILEHGRRTITGRFEKDRRAGYVLPDDDRFDSDIYIPLSLTAGAKPGDKVLAELTSFPKGKMVGGKIIEILGEDGDFAAEELSIIRSYDLRQEFPEEVESAAEAVSKQKIVPDSRKDFRDLLTITIDGDDTRDIDDAVSLEKDGDDYVLGVHIADVSHYVKLNDIVDREAYKRGTSVYFPDRVLPMLPKALSNGACSLNEGEDRYAMSCVMVFDAQGRRKSYRIYESIIKSDRRMTYNEVTSILDAEGAKDKEYPYIAPMLREMAKLCLIMESNRRAAGEVSLDVKEAHIYVDESGKIVIPDYERALSHRMIEQFMVSANEAVAEFAERKKAPFLYRIHERPSPEKASLFFSFLKDLGINVRLNPEEIEPSDFQRILETSGDKPYASVINRVMLRSMQKARYSEENLGHFGLASHCYCHFTSPIRRYPDLFVHRVLKELLHGDEGRAKKLYAPIAHEAGIDTSEKERIADAAERDVDDLYKVMYMNDRIGEEYDAVISGVISSGIFAELANTIEGMIRYDLLPDDDYEYIEDKMTLRGRRHSFRIGDNIKVKVIGCDFGTRRVQFSLV